MIGFLEGLKVTLKTAGRKPVTAEYPEPKKRLEVQERYMGFPALLWDGEVAEPYCTGCMVCIRDCPTQCMSAQMMDNPKFEEGSSRRRKIINEFEINLGRCILCGICVDVCNFDAIEMSHEHELSKYRRNGNRVDLPRLLDMGREYQAKIGWKPTQPEKNSGVPVKRTEPAATATAAVPGAVSKEDRLAAARARAAAKQQPAEGEASGTAIQTATKEDRLAAARARAAAKQQPAEGEASGTAIQTATQEDRLAAARARAAAKREAAEGEAGGTAIQTATQEDRLAAARARAAAKREAAEGEASGTASDDKGETGTDET